MAESGRLVAMVELLLPLQSRPRRGGFRLTAAAEIWQACGRRRYQTLTCYLARGPLFASNRKLAGLQ